MNIATNSPVPGTYLGINNKRAIDTFGTDAFSVCIFGEHGVPASSVDTDIKYQRVYSEADAYSKYGNSVSYELLRDYFRNLDTSSPVEVSCVSKPINIPTTVLSKYIKVGIPSTFRSGVIRVVENGEPVYVNILSTDTADKIVKRIVNATASLKTVLTSKIASVGTDVLQWTNDIGTTNGLSDTLIENSELKIVIESYKNGPVLALQSNVDMSSPTYGDYATRVSTIVNIFNTSIPNTVTFGGWATGTAAGDDVLDPTPIMVDLVLTRIADINGYPTWTGSVANDFVKIWYGEYYSEGGDYWNMECYTDEGTVGGNAALTQYKVNAPSNSLIPPKVGWEFALNPYSQDPTNNPGYIIPSIDYTLPTSSSGISIDLADYISVLPDEVIDLFIPTYTGLTNYALLKTEIDRRFSPIVQLEGHQLITKTGTITELATTMDSYNDAHLTVWDGGVDRPTPQYLQSAAVGGLISTSLSVDPVVPMMHLVVNGVLPDQPENNRLYEDMVALVNLGIAINTVNRQGEVETARITTSYTNTDGFPDDSYRDANTIYTTSYLRQSLIRFIALTYKNYKLADDGIKVAAGQRVATPKRIRASILGWFKHHELNAIVENYAQFAQDLVVVRDEHDKTRVNTVIPCDVVNQFRILAGEIQFKL